ncbi:MAG: hypothetical protein FWD26_10370 [Treponema sp.]|nr:hypothetical protein [Treponema sp.]
MFYLFRRAFIQSGGSGVWALLLGSITAIIQFFLGYLVSPGGFGFTRVLFGFIDIVSLPVLIPLVLYLIILIFKRFSGDFDFANFALLWLIPVGALRALSWSSTNDPILLIMAPVLWTALAAGIPFFINLMVKRFRIFTAFLSFIGIIILPVLASMTYWAFFSQHTLIGFGLLLATHIPLILSFFFDAKSN